MIRLEKVCYRFETKSDFVLRDISLCVKPGEKICLLGANGSGKTTLALIIASVLEPSSGSIVTELGKDDTAGRDNHVGLLFQNPDNQMVAMVVENDIAFSLENRGMSSDLMFSRVAEQLALFNLTALSNRVVSTLSGGEKQLAALCGVMIDSPPVLLLDEPDSFLDMERQALLSSELDRIRRENPSLIEIRLSPRPIVAKDYDRVCVLRDGCMVYDGPPNGFIGSEAKLAEYGLSSKVLIPDSFNTGVGSRIEKGSVLLHGVSFAYEKEHSVLENCSLSIRSGEIVGLIGATGSGKSTIGQLLCGLLEPDSGTVVLREENGHESKPFDKPGRIVGTFQQPERQFFLSSCAEEIRFGPENLGLSLTDKQVEDFIRQVGLGSAEFAKRDPLTLSLGEKRRLAFACILSMSPSFLVFDEPTAGLDPVGESWFKYMAGDLRKQGCGILIISHDRDLIASLADRICRIDGGFAREISTESP